MSNSPNVTRADVLAILLNLGRRARQAEDRAELAFVMANETFALAPYRQAALWIDGKGVAAVSGVVSVEANAPYMQFLEGVFRHLGRTLPGDEPRILSAAELLPADVEEWGHWLPPQALWLPLPRIGKRLAGGAVLLARDTAWTAPETAVLGEWAGIWGHAHAAHDRHPLHHLWDRIAGGKAAQPTQTWRERICGWRNSRKVWVLAALGMALIFPVHLTVLAPAEIIPLDPFIVRSPVDGVVDRIPVVPNQQVKAGDVLIEFDRTNVANRLLVAERALDTVRAELRQRAQQALSDDTHKPHLVVLQGQVAEKTIEVGYLRELSARSTVAAPRDGTVLFDDPVEWIGRPVVTGERVMVLADEGKVQVEAWLSPSNAITLEKSARVIVYLNADPLRPVEAALRSVGHEALLRPDGQYAYRVRAALAPDAAGARAGLKGTAKLEGATVPLVYWVLRRPLAEIRSWLGV